MLIWVTTTAVKIAHSPSNGGTFKGCESTKANSGDGPPQAQAQLRPMVADLAASSNGDAS
jgi:hypothetical protein